MVRVMTKEEFESAINEDIKFVERFKHFFKHDDVARIIEHVKSVLEASVDYFYPNHPEVEFEKDFNIQYDVNNILNKYGHTEMGMYKIQLYIENILGSIQNKKPVDVGEVSDGYHTFNELYRYSMLYNAAFFNLLARSGQVEVCKMRCHLGAGRQEASLSAHQYTIRNRVLWIETPLYTISTCGIRYSP